MRKLVLLMAIISGSMIAMEDSPENKLKKVYEKFIENMRALNKNSADIEVYINQAQKLDKSHNFSADIYKDLCIGIVPQILGAAVAQRNITNRVFAPHIDAAASLLPKDAAVLVTHCEKIAHKLNSDVFCLAEAEAKFIMAQNVCDDIKRRAGL